MNSIEPMKQGNHVPALEKTIAIFDYLEKNPNGAALSEISSALGIPKSTAHGILSTLTHYGYVSSNIDTARFILGTRFLSLALATEKGLDLVRIAYPYMKILRDEVNETVKLSVKSNRSAVVVGRLEAEKEYHASTKIGSAFPLHAGAAGKVLLAFSSDEERETYFASPLENYTKMTITAPQKLRRELSRILKDFYAEDIGERFEDIRAVACPVFNHTGAVLAGISVAFLASQNEEKKKKEILKHLIQSARKISEAFGYSMPAWPLS